MRASPIAPAGPQKLNFYTSFITTSSALAFLPMTTSQPELITLPELPLEIWRQIATSLVIPAETSILRHEKFTHACVYWVLVRTAKRFVLHDAESLFIRIMHTSWGGSSYLPNNRRHSVNDLPAKIGFSKQHWYQHGRKHRDGGPAMKGENKEKWYQNGFLHRADGPAWTENDKQQWYWCGELHRDGGPAWVSAISHTWYQRGEVHRDGLPASVDANGSQSWYQHDKHHRDELPAIIGADGSQLWYRHGKQHRDFGPAIIHSDGTQEWWRNGERYHKACVNGEQHWGSRGFLPAVIFADGRQRWDRLLGSDLSGALAFYLDSMVPA